MIGDPDVVLQIPEPVSVQSNRPDALLSTPA